MIEAVEGNASGFVSERFTGHEAMNFMPGYYIRAKLPISETAPGLRVQIS